jgi:DNA-binding transcriptional LysR family regulator
VPIHRDELVLIVPPRHPLAKLKSAAAADIAQYPLVMPKVGHTRDALDELFHQKKLKPRYAMEVDSSELLKRFVAADVGVGFIARSHVQEDVQARVLATVPLAEAQIRRDLALVFRKDKALSRAALAFIDITVKIKTAESAISAKR